MVTAGHGWMRKETQLPWTTNLEWEIAVGRTGEGVLVDAAKEFGNFEIQCFCYGLDAVEREIALSPFYLTNICPVHTAHFRHPFLRPFPLFPKLADAGSEDGLKIFCHP